MSTVGQVHWHEGLFLQPHHLQTMSREWLDAGARERRLSWAFPYGVVECKISTDALENMLVRIDRLRAVMPSGLEVDVPGNADIPALDIKRVFQASSGAFTVSLAVPLWQLSRANTVEPASTAGVAGGATRKALNEEVRVKRLYRISEVPRVDENTGENSQPVLIRRLNARLVVDGDDTSDMELLPLVRIVHSAEEATMPRPDAKFVPPCMVLGGSPTLRSIVRDLGAAVEASRKELVNQLTRGGFVVENLRPPQFMQVLRLRTLNKWSARLPTLVAGGVGGAGSMPPFAAYLELRELLGDLAALSPERDQFEGPKYDHDNPGVVFLELDKKIRPLLRGDVQKRFMQAAFIKDGAALSVAITDEQLTQPNGYFIGIKTRMDPTALAKLVEDQDKFKLMPKSMIKLNIYGIKLAEERHPPMEMPSSVDLHYFRVDVGASQKMWERMAGEKAMSIRWPENEPLEYTDVSLYMTVP